MSIDSGNGKGNLLISYLFQSDNPFRQVDEEIELKNEIAKLLCSKGYTKFIIADNEIINEKLTRD